MIDVPKKKIIDLKDHPELVDTQTLPFCGDFRYSYHYIKPDRTKDFEKYVFLSGLPPNFHHLRIIKRPEMQPGGEPFGGHFQLVAAAFDKGAVDAIEAHIRNARERAIAF